MTGNYAPLYKITDVPKHTQVYTDYISSTQVNKVYFFSSSTDCNMLFQFGLYRKGV